eukprot:s211_g2.t1
MYRFTFLAALVRNLGCQSACKGRLGKLTVPCNSMRSKGKKTPAVPLSGLQLLACSTTPSTATSTPKSQGRSFSRAQTLGSLLKNTVFEPACPPVLKVAVEGKVDVSVRLQVIGAKAEGNGLPQVCAAGKLSVATYLALSAARGPMTKGSLMIEGFDPVPFCVAHNDQGTTFVQCKGKWRCTALSAARWNWRQNAAKPTEGKAADLEVHAAKSIDNVPQLKVSVRDASEMELKRCLQGQALRDAQEEGDYDALLAQVTKAKQAGVDREQIEQAEDRLQGMRKLGKHVNDGCDKETLQSLMQWEKVTRCSDALTTEACKVPGCPCNQEMCGEVLQVVPNAVQNCLKDFGPEDVSCCPCLKAVKLGSRWREICVGTGPEHREAVDLVTLVALHMANATLPAPALCIQALRASRLEACDVEIGPVKTEVAALVPDASECAASVEASAEETFGAALVSRRPRRRSRTPLFRRLEGVLQAHERDRKTRRGGLQAKNRTRAIHRHLLEILLEYTLCVFLHFLIQGQLGVDSSSREKTRFERGCGFWKGAGQRARGLSCQDSDCVKIKTKFRLTVDLRSRLLSFRKTQRQLLQPLREKARPCSPSPVELQTPKAFAASSSSSSRPAVAKAIAIRPAVPKAIAISSVGEEDERWDPEILRIGAEIYDRQGQLIRSVQPRVDQIPFISIDYHQVLDRCNLSRRQILRLAPSGQLHQRVLDGLTTAAQGATLIALSYCHAELDRPYGQHLWDYLNLGT